MDLSDPIWRKRLSLLMDKLFSGQATAREAAATRQLIDETTSDYFDHLVYCVASRDLDGAIAVLKARYPGSYERAVAIKDALRGEDQGSIQ